MGVKRGGPGPKPPLRGSAQPGCPGSPQGFPCFLAAVSLLRPPHSLSSWWRGVVVIKA